MSTDVQWYGDGFAGKKRQQIIHMRLFNLLSNYGSPRDEDIVYDWLTHGLSWRMISEDEVRIFASLAKAIPIANFDYETSFDYEGGGLDQMYHTIEYANGTLDLSTLHRFGFYGEDDDKKEDNWDDDYSCRVGEDSVSLSCTVGKDGNIIGDEKLAQDCLALEKENFAKILGFVGTDTDNPAELMDLGMLYETGLAGIDRNLTAAWDYYLKAAQTGDKKAVEFVKEIFSDESKEDFHKLLANKWINKESFDILFDLALEVRSAELTAELLEYKDSYENDIGVETDYQLAFKLYQKVAEQSG